MKITIDGRELVVDGGITVLEAARRNDIYIPTLCHHEALTPWGGCRLCVVEVDGAPKLAASCVTPARDGMQVVTTSERIVQSRRAMLEFLFAERNHNCMFCPRSGDCELQKLAYELQMDHLTVSFSFQSFPTDVTNEFMVMDHNRCILCGRCVRGCAELAGTHVLNFQNRGPRSLIGMDLNESRESSTCYACGICMQVCPTGAISGRYRTHYAVKGHSKDWKEVESPCPHCGLLCPTVVTARDGQLLKVDGRLQGLNGRPDRGQLCYRGRFEALKQGRRLTGPMVRTGVEWKEVSWEEALNASAEGLKGVARQGGPETLFGLAAGSLSNEDLFLFREVMDKSLPKAFRDTLDGRHFRGVVKSLEEEGLSLREASWRQIPEADFVLLAGGSPYRSQPLIASLLRRGMLERGLNVAVVGETDCLVPLMARHLPVQAGKETPLFDALVCAALAGGGDVPDGLRKRIGPEVGKVDVPSALDAAGLDEAAKEGFHQVVKSLMGSRNPLLIVGPELSGNGGDAGLRRAIQLALLKGLLPDRSPRVIFLKSSGNSAGAWRLGIPSRTEEGDPARRTGGLILLGGEEDASQVAPGVLDGLKFLAVVTPCFQEAIAKKAHVLLPGPAWPEGEGTFTSLDGRETAYKGRIVGPSEGTKDLWQILLPLAGKLGAPLKMVTWEEVRAAAMQAMRSAIQA